MEPEPGMYHTRFVKGGPLVACRILFDGRLWFLFIGGKLVGSDSDPWRIRSMESVAFTRKKLDEAAYFAMLAAAEAAPAGDPLANDGAVDLRSAPPLYRKQPR